jgi:uncharacterized membrane protein
MNFPDALFPDAWHWAAHGLLLLSIVVLVRAPWARLRDAATLNLWLAAIVVLMLLWSVKTGVKPGLSLHVLGATALTLMFGPGLAFVALALVVAAITLAGQAGWQAYSMNLLLLGGMPIAVSHALFKLVDRRLPNHFFVYVFINAFFGGALAMGVTGLVSTLIVALAGVYPMDYLTDQYLPYYMLMAWSEALLTGMAVSLMVVFRPAWVATFDDTRYLNR